MIRLSYKITGLVLLMITAMLSCKKHTDAFELTRMFMPSGEIKATAGETSAAITWDASIYTKSTDSTVYYTVQISTDSAFGTVARTYSTDTTGVIVTEDSINVRVKYFARVKTNGKGNSSDSYWVTSKGFAITGEQIFYAVRETETRDSSVMLRWRPTTGLTKIVITPATGAPIEIALTAGDITNTYKLITGLTPGTTYTAEVFAANKSKGYISFTTAPANAFTIILTPADNLATVLDTCSNNAVIGLQPGAYSAGTTNFTLKQKTVTIRSVSGNPADTKVNFKEFTLKGTGAGIKLADIEFDGLASAGAYFINLTGLNSDAEAATFTSVEVTNCVVHNFGNCLVRANRGANASDHKIGTMKFRNCLVYDNLVTAAYTLFTLDKLQFTKLDISNSTFYNIGQAMITWATTLTATPIGIIVMDGCTINYLGGNSKYILVDASANPVDFTFQNSILATCPRPSSAVQTTILRATAASSVLNFSYNNYFNLYSTNVAGSTPLALTLPTYSYLSASNNRTIDLGWISTTTNFTLPATSELRSAGKTGGPVGDPRWTY